MFWNYLWNYFSVGTTVVNEILLGQTQSVIARNFPRLKIKFIFNKESYLVTISRDVSAIAIIQCHTYWNLPLPKQAFWGKYERFAAAKYCRNKIVL